MQICSRDDKRQGLIERWPQDGANFRLDDIVRTRLIRPQNEPSANLGGDEIGAIPIVKYAIGANEWNFVDVGDAGFGECPFDGSAFHLCLGRVVDVHDGASGTHTRGWPTRATLRLENASIRCFDEPIATPPCFGLVHATVLDVKLHRFADDRTGDGDFATVVEHDDAIKIVVEIDDISLKNIRHENISSIFSSYRRMTRPAADASLTPES